jgi:hypothetical protein
MDKTPLKGRIREWFEKFLELTSREGDFEEVFVTYDPVEAEMLKDVLEGGGIDVVLRSAKVTPFPVNVGKTGEIQLLVPKQDAAEARKLIESFVGE